MLKMVICKQFLKYQWNTEELLEKMSYGTTWLQMLKLKE